MSRAVYQVRTTAQVALTAVTARTVLAVVAPSTFGVDLLGFSLGFDGVTPTDKPVVWELCSLTAVSNSTPGTNNTSESVVQEGGRSIVAGFVAFSGSTTEPTVLTVVKSGLLSPNGGYYEYEFPFDASPDSPVSQGFALRCTTPSGSGAVNCRAGFRFARI